MVKLDDEKRKLVEENYTLVQYMLNKLGLYKDTYKDEYHGALTLGLCKAASAFDISRGATFCTFACKCMTNEVLMLKRSLHKDNISGYATVSYNIVMGDGDGVELIDLIPDDDCFQCRVEQSEAIANTLKELRNKYLDSGSKQKQRDYRMLSLNINGVGQEKIADLFGISQASVSRRINKVREDLRSMLIDAGVM